MHETPNDDVMPKATSFDVMPETPNDDVMLKTTSFDVMHETPNDDVMHETPSSNVMPKTPSPNVIPKTPSPDVISLRDYDGDDTDLQELKADLLRIQASPVKIIDKYPDINALLI